MSRRKCFSLILTLVLLVSNLSFSLPVVPLSLTATVSAQSASFGEVTFCQEVTGDGQPVKPATMFAQGTKVVQALFAYQGMTDGSLWRREWKRDGRLISGAADTWAAGESG